MVALSCHRTHVPHTELERASHERWHVRIWYIHSGMWMWMSSKTFRYALQFELEISESIEPVGLQEGITLNTPKPSITQFLRVGKWENAFRILNLRPLRSPNETNQRHGACEDIIKSILIMSQCLRRYSRTPIYKTLHEGRPILFNFGPTEPWTRSFR